MKKIRTITFHSVLNYGAIIQTYALVKHLRNIGYDARLINYQPFYFIKQVYRPSLGFLKTFQKIKKIIKFNAFREKFIPQTSFYSSINSLKKINADFFICGSDQIWNMRVTNNALDKSFFLEFAKPESRIAYAASSGHFRLDSKYNDLLKNFHAIGVREESLKQNIKEINTELNVQTVLDPCLLLDDYDEVLSTERVPVGKFILSYCVGSGDTIKNFESVLSELRKHTNLPIYHVGSHKSEYSDFNLLDLSPSDWLGFFKNADFIVTSSFHGLAMSIKFRRNFITIPHSIEMLNNRQNTLLKNLKLFHRALNDNKQLRSIYFEEINYKFVQGPLDLMLKDSKQFLKDSIV